MISAFGIEHGEVSKATKDPWIKYQTHINDETGKGITRNLPIRHTNKMSRGRLSTDQAFHFGNFKRYVGADGIGTIRIIPGRR